MSGSPENPASVIFRLGHMGDVALATGVLARRHETTGETYAFITREANAPLLENHPAVTETVALSPEQMADWSATARDLARRFAGRTLVDLHAVLRSRILSLRWKGAVKRYPKFGLTRRLYDRTRLELFRKKLEATTVPQRYAMAWEDRPPPAGEVVPRLFPTEAERETAGLRLAGLPLAAPSAAPLAALHPYATHPAKQWPRASWLALIELLEKENIDWLVVGRSESPLAPGDPRDLTNVTGLRETCAILERADALATNDSGPMHLACGVGTPVTALFGPTARAWGFYPAGPRDTVLERALDCRPCSLHGARPCARGFECMASITPDEVLDAVRRSLAG